MQQPGVAAAPAPAPPMPPPPVAAPVSQPRMQLLQVTRPVSGPTSHSMRPGQQIIVADPNGHRFQCVVPPNIAPGQTFHVQVPVPGPAPVAQPSPPAPAAPRPTGGPPDFLGEFLPSKENLWRSAGQGALGGGHEQRQAGKLTEAGGGTSVEDRVNASSSSKVLPEKLSRDVPLHPR